MKNASAANNKCQPNQEEKTKKNEVFLRNRLK